METTQTPLILFTYNRPEHTQSALRSLSHCSRLMDCHLVIYCDGPKNPVDDTGVAATRQVVRKWTTQFTAEVIERAENIGLARSIVTGVTEQCQKYGKAIVLEDDLVVSPDFLDYMLLSLERYKKSANVYQISGFMFPVQHPSYPDAFFLPLTTTWGWATWERAWDVFNWDADDSLQMLENKAIRRRFTLDNSYPYDEILKNRLKTQNDSWGILWWYAVFKVSGLVLHPRQSLVWNGGFDNSGIHSGAPSDTMQLSRNTFDYPILGPPFYFPEEIGIDTAAFNRLKTYLRSRSSRRGRLIGKLRRLKSDLISSQTYVRSNTNKDNI